ncbi:MAG: M20 family metallopeptidase [Verrucomicrobia bacterium]|nr:M20 family metallopeptidase [Verrucomicrobiota bacterium]
MTPVLKLLRDLVALPSVNPAFTPAADPLSGEERVAEHLRSCARKAKLDAEFQPVLPHRSNLLIRLAPRGRAKRRIVLAPHFDTVTLHDLSQLEPRIRSGRLYGRGSCDTKASVASMFQAMVNVSRMPSRPNETEIVLAGLIDEESGQSGSRALVRSEFRADFAIVGEPTRLRVVTAHKGDLWLAIQTRGKAAHGSEPHRGSNAITHMSRVIQTLEGPYAAQLKRERHPLLGSATLNIGTISGGRQPNIVPNFCEIRVDRRTLPHESDAAVVRGLKATLRQHGCQAVVRDWKGVPSRPLETPANLPWVQALLAVARQKVPAGVNFFSDAGVLADGGIPSVVFGPGDIAQAHTIDEWVSVDEVERATALLTRFLGGLA